MGWALSSVTAVPVVKCAAAGLSEGKVKNNKCRFYCHSLSSYVQISPQFNINTVIGLNKTEKQKLRYFPSWKSVCVAVDIIQSQNSSCSWTDVWRCDHQSWTAAAGGPLDSECLNSQLVLAAWLVIDDVMWPVLGSAGPAEEQFRSPVQTEGLRERQVNTQVYTQVMQWTDELFL